MKLQTYTHSIVLPLFMQTVEFHLLPDISLPTIKAESHATVKRMWSIPPFLDVLLNDQRIENLSNIC